MSRMLDLHSHQNQCSLARSFTWFLVKKFNNQNILVMHDYSLSLKKINENFPQRNIYFAQVEVQPSICTDKNPSEKCLKSFQKEFCEGRLKFSNPAFDFEIY